MADDYCEMCELPLSQCVHGRPPPPPPVVAPKAPAAPRVRAVRAVAPARRVQRRWTPAEELRAPLLRILVEHGGRLETDDLMRELEATLADRLTPGDLEQAPQGGLRWHLATRKQRKAMIDDGLLAPGQPGVWQLTQEGRSAALELHG